jgi:predicted nucleic acid-binding protein
VIVVDASALLELLLWNEKAEVLEPLILASDASVHAPHLLDLEVTQVLRRLVLAKQLTLTRAEEAFQDFSQLHIQRHAHQPLTERIWSLRDTMSAYDGSYVALAEAIDAPLVTCDAKLASSKRHHATIRFV